MQIIEIDEIGDLSKKKESNNIAIGIDFGTTNSLVAISKAHLPKIIPDHTGRELIPTIITEKNDVFIIGDTTQVKNTIYSIKRLLGKNREEILNTPALLSIVEGFIDQNSKNFAIKLSNKSFTIPFLVAEILLSLKKQAESNLKTEIIEAVITVPAYFDDAARGELMLAAKIAGLNVLRLIAEPTAAAYAYGLNKDNVGCYLVYDLGGGTFDVSILNMQAGILQVIAAGGNNMLGGDDIDQLILDYFIQEYGLLPSLQLRHIARCAKETLTYQERFSYTVPDVGEILMNKGILKELISPLIKRTIDITNDTVLQAGNPEITGIILVGGSTRIYLIPEMLRQHFNNVTIFSDIDPDKTVAWGAALQAENLTSPSNSSLLIDVVPLSLGMELYGGIVEKIILKNSPIPLSITKEFTTYLDNQTAMQFHILQGERELVKDCRSLAKFELKDLPSMKAGSVKIEVTFSIDADGILSVSAFEKLSGKSHLIEIKPTYGLKDEEITSILEDAYKNAYIDQESKLLQEAVFDANSLIYNLENAIKETPDILSGDEMAKIDKVIIDLKNLLSSNGRDEIINQTKKLERAAEDFVSQRLNNSIVGMLKGKHVDDVK